MRQKAASSLTLQQCPIVICGETGSGKTVLTRALLKSLHKDERVIILEDVHEVTVDHV
ncbi:ATPase, T2SS/T4P/T4SS family, partial [Citrobacter freundii]